MLHMFHTYVASAFIWMLRMCCNCFQVFQTHALNVSSVFRRMLQVLYLDVSKVDRVLHFPPRFLLPRLGVFSSPSAALHPS
jgi:hypothetical protein